MGIRKGIGLNNFGIDDTYRQRDERDESGDMPSYGGVPRDGYVCRTIT